MICLALVWIACGGAAAVAAEGCHHCERCGCSADCCKVCRCVPDIKKVTKTTYSCECEDFCVPGPSGHCVVYDECGKKTDVFTPGCATIRTRKKLVKHDTPIEVKKYKWVVENLCPHCASHEQAETAPATLALGLASGAEGRQVAYESPTDIGRRANDPAAPSPPPGSDVKSQFRRVFDPILGSGQSDR